MIPLLSPVPRFCVIGFSASPASVDALKSFGHCSLGLRHSSGIVSMNCLSGCGGRHTILHRDVAARATRKNCRALQTNSFRSPALTRLPSLPTAKAQQHHQTRSKQRKLVRCQSSQLAGPGQWGQAVRCRLSLQLRCAKALCHKSPPLRYRLTIMWS